MLKTTNFQQLDSFFREKYLTEIAPVANFLTDFVTDSSKWSTFDLTRLRLPGVARKKINLVKLSIIHWYFPEEARFLVRLWLEENWCEEFIAERAVLLSSKENALGYLLIQDEWSDSDFWGNIASKKKRLIPWFNSNLVTFEKKVKKVKRKVRRRGYRDGKSGEYPRREKSVGRSYIRPENEWILTAEELIVQRRRLTLFQKIQERLRSELVS